MKPTFRTALIAAAALLVLSVLVGCRPRPPAQAPAEGHRVAVNGMQMYFNC